MQDERLHVEQPEGGGEHPDHREREKNSRACATKTGKRGQAEANKVG